MVCNKRSREFQGKQKLSRHDGVGSVFFDSEPFRIQNITSKTQVDKLSIKNAEPGPRAMPASYAPTESR